MTQLITIAAWKETFENADTRKRQRLKSFHAPSGIESRGLVNLLCKCPDQQQALAAFGVFQLLCQLSATLPADHRGSLIHSDNSPMSLEFLSRLLRVDICHLSAALELLESDGVAWIIRDGPKEQSATSCQSSPSFVQGEGEGEGEGEGSVSPREEARIEPEPDSPPGEAPSVDGYPTLRQAIAAGENMMILADVTTRWWHDRNGMDWQWQGTAMSRTAWQSNLKSYASRWQQNEGRGRRPGASETSKEPKQYGGTEWDPPEMG